MIAQAASGSVPSVSRWSMSGVVLSSVIAPTASRGGLGTEAARGIAAERDAEEVEIVLAR